MTRLIPCLAAAAVLGAASAATAQVAPYGPYGAPASVADQHAYEMDRLRWQSDQRAAEARRYQADAQLRIREVEAARQPTPPSEPVWRGAGPPDAAADRWRQDVAATTQIDDWLDRRSPN